MSHYRNKTNLLVRQAMHKHHLRVDQTAELCGISEPTFFIRLREEMPEEEQLRIVNLIESAPEPDDSFDEKNQIILSAIYDKRIWKWEAAKILGVSYTTFNRWLRKELPEACQIEIANKIKEGV